MKAILSKSTFLKGLQCDKHLYLYKHHYNLQDPITDNQQAIFDRGHQVGKLAQQLFPGGIDASTNSPRAYAKAVEFTKKQIDAGKKIIYEAAFIYNQVLVYADIMVKSGSNWKVYEVKSSTSISETNIYDAAIQYYTISNTGLRINDISIIYINNDYVRNGDLVIDKLFSIESVFELALEKQDEVNLEVERLKKVIAGKTIPHIDIGPHCSNPYNCAFIGHCWKHIPQNSVFDINNMRSTKKFDLYNSGIVNIEDIPDGFPLSANHQIQVDGHKYGETVIIRSAIKEFLKTINYPLYFMDFETFQPAIPMFDNSKPYQQIPFQYSLHYQKSKKAKLEHSEFLADADQSDPRIPFIENLLEATKGEGDIIVYNKTFEIMILNSIARDFPNYTDEIEERISRVKDLMIPFQKKWYYLPKMRGSYSIKYVLPALVPELSYSELEIVDGGSAQLAFENLFYETDLFKIEETRKNLLEYCKLDTLAMVEILNKLKET
jgi:uncharacterized protein DUF2779